MTPTTRSRHGLRFGDYFMHDADADAYACSLGNNEASDPMTATIRSVYV